MDDCELDLNTIIPLPLYFIQPSNSAFHLYLVITSSHINYYIIIVVKAIPKIVAKIVVMACKLLC